MSLLQHYEYLSSIITWMDGQPYVRLSVSKLKLTGSLTANGSRLLTSTADGKRVKILAHRLFWFMKYGYPVPKILKHRDKNKDSNRDGNVYAVGEKVESEPVSIDPMLPYYEHFAFFVVWRRNFPCRLLDNGEWKILSRSMTATINGEAKTIQSHRLRWFMLKGLPIPRGLQFSWEHIEAQQKKYGLEVKS